MAGWKDPPDKPAKNVADSCKQTEADSTPLNIRRSVLGRDEALASAVTELYQSWYSTMVRFASRLTGNVEIAEEIVQESFLDLYLSLQRGGEVRHHRAWVMRVIRRKVWRLFNLDPDEQLTHESLELLGTAEPSDLPEAHHNQLAEMLDVLTTRETEVILLRAAGLSYSEIGNELQMATGTVGALLARALRKMQATSKDRTSVRENLEANDRNGGETL